MNDELDEDEVAEAIQRYLAEHPRAADTVEGIAEWWLMRHQVRVTIATVERALRRLAEKGALEIVGEGEHRRYRLKG